MSGLNGRWFGVCVAHDLAETLAPRVGRFRGWRGLPQRISWRVRLGATLFQDILIRALTSESAFRRLIALVVVTAAALTVLLGVLLYARRDISWWPLMAADGLKADDVKSWFPLR